MAETTQYRYMGTHAHEFQIGGENGTRPQVEPGGFIELSAEDLKDNELVKDKLMEITDKNKGKEDKA